MLYYIDIHCHILPGVDDGPADMKEAIELSKALSRLGISCVIATPHYLDGADYSDKRQEEIDKAFYSLRYELKRENVPLDIYRGGELMLTPELVSLADRDKLPRLAGSSYLLVELPFFQPLPAYAGEVIFELQARGYRLIMAHPERIETFKDRPQYIYEHYQKGILYQLNLGSFFGLYGRRAKRLAYMMTEKGLFHFLATDGHNLSVEKLSFTEIFTGELTEKPSFYDNPLHVLNDEEVTLDQEIEALDETDAKEVNKVKNAKISGPGDSIWDKIKNLLF